MTNSIPFLDLIAPHQQLKEELMAVFDSALDTGAFIGGPVVEAFEKEFAQFCDAPYCVGVGSGTDALRFALMAAGVQKNELVVTVPNTFIATAEAISQAGADPVFVDVEERTHEMDPDELRGFLQRECVFDVQTGRTRHRKSEKIVSAIVPVHLFGQMPDMDPILELAERYHLLVIEDAAQAHGAEYYSKRLDRWLRAGSIGTAAAFSFYPGKNLGACGEAGAVTTGDPAIARKIRMLRDHGQSQKYYHEVEGYNGRLDAIQAGILRTKLPHLTRWNVMRSAAAARYRQLFTRAGSSVILPYEPSWARSVYHLFVVRVDDRAGLMKHLAASGIGTGIHYPVPLHLQTAYQHLGYKKGDLPMAEKLAAEIVSLPMYPQLMPDPQRRVAEEVLAFTGVEHSSVIAIA